MNEHEHDTESNLESSPEGRTDEVVTSEEDSSSASETMTQTDNEPIRDIDEPAAEDFKSDEIESDAADSEVVSQEESESEEPAEADSKPVTHHEPEPEPEPVSNKNWYIVKVTSGREESIKAAIERKVRIEGLEEFFGQVYIPVERTVEIKKVRVTKNGQKETRERRVTKEQKKFPGYIMAEVEFNDRILYLFRETSGVGDFVGGAGPLKPPPPMTEIEVRRMRGEDVADEKADAKKLKVKLDFEKGDKVRIREGAFANMEGEIKEITDPKETGETPKVTVEVVVIGRPLPVVLDYWQVDKI